jgi:hypothetical protein
MSTGAARGKTLEIFPHFVGLDEARGVRLSDKNAESVNRIDEAELLQFQQRFPNRPLADTQFSGQALLGQSLAGKALSRQNPALNLIPHVPAKRR